MFHGETAINLDTKGRLAMPTRYRGPVDEICQGHMVLTYNPLERFSLWLYPLGEWERVQAEVMGLSSFDAGHRWLQRYLVGSASRVDLDSQGRIQVPQTLRETAGLDKRVALLGLGAKFEVWDAQKLNDTRQERMQNGGPAAEPSAEMAELRL